MADQTMFDITVASMKIGVAVPIRNHRFLYWDDPGTWQNCSQWKAINSNFDELFRYENPDGVFEGYEDAAMLHVADNDAGDYWDHIIHGNNEEGILYWHPNQFELDINQEFYYVVAAKYATGTGGANKGISFFFDIGTTPAMTTSTNQIFLQWLTGSSDLALFKGTMTTITVIPGYDYCKVKLAIRDITGIWQVRVSSVAIMFNPFDKTGYYELSNVFPANGPFFSYDRFTRLVRTNQQVGYRYDPTGGAERIRLQMEFRNEDEDFYETMLKFYRLNHGTPGLPGLPLALEPNIPGLPPVIMGNIMNQGFPLRRDAARAQRYSGTFTFESIW